MANTRTQKPQPRSSKQAVPAKKATPRVPSAARAGKPAPAKSAARKPNAAKRNASANAGSKAGAAMQEARSTRKPPATASIQRRATTPSRVAPDAKSIAHALHGLLHTMHAIQRHEETLCSLAHALEHGRGGAATLRELQRALEQLPAHDYLHEVEALRDAAES